MRLLLAAAFAAAPISPAAALPLHQFSSLALSPAGDRVAAVETDEEPNSSTKAQEHVVVRSVTTGAVAARLASCPGCTYSDLSFAPDGRLLAIVKDKGTTRLVISDTGEPRRSPVSRASHKSRAFHRTARAWRCLRPSMPIRRSGATQAGVRQVGEIGETNDEQRIAVVPLAGGALRPVSPGRSLRLRI